jgi:hypothetical protein
LRSSLEEPRTAGRLEGWPRVPTLCPSFETRPRGRCSG